MILGIVSDSHGHHETTGRAVAAVRDAGAERLVHLGDVGSERVLDELVGHDANVVFGNCDPDHDALARYAENVGITVDHPRGTLELVGRTVAFTHGHLHREVAAALAMRPDYLLVGHTHQVSDERIDDVRVINPGALFRAPRYTAAVLDLERDRLRILEIPK